MQSASLALRQISQLALGAFVAVFTLVNCAPVGTHLEAPASSSSDPNDSSPTTDLGDDPTQAELPPLITPPTAEAPALKFCSSLDFKGVEFPAGMSAAERRAFSVALTISGSFEGPNGWINITNDFDGMGLSAGLLNQTLGTGSLQPLLLRARARDPRAFDVLNRDRRASLNGMLDRWQAARKFKTSSSKMQFGPDEAGDEESSRLDEDFHLTSSDTSLGSKELKTVSTLATLASAEQSSVEWARDNLYQPSPRQAHFRPEWKRELQLLLATPAVRTEQVLAALQLHARAKQYAQRLGRKDLRHYLTMFDIAVQNGGLKSEEFGRVEAWANSRRWSDTDRLRHLVEIRIERVRTQYKEDVRRRKFSLITGEGNVHGRMRRHEKEACIRLTEAAF